MPKQRGVDGLYKALLLLLGAALILRCRYGFDWSDETYYTTLIYRLAQGDRLFADMWELHQLSAIPPLPLMKLYLWINGGTEGVILFFRVCFALTEIVCALIIYSLLTKRCRPFFAFIAAALSAAFVHFSLCNFSYDSLPPLLLTLSAILLINGGEEKSLVKTAVSGSLFALAVQCYPQLIAAAAVYAGYFFLRRREDENGLALRRFLLGNLLVALLFSAFLLVNSSFPALFQNLPDILADPTHGGGNKLRLTLNYFHTILVILSPWGWITAGATLAALILRLRCKGPLTGRLRAVFNGLVLLLGFFMTLCVLLYDAESANHNNFFAIPLAALGPLAYLVNRGKRGDAPSPTEALALLLYALGAVFSLAAQLTSNMGIYASSFPLMLCSIGVILYLSCHLPQEGHLPSLALAGLSAFLLLCCVAFRMAGSHREAPIDQLDARLLSGPGKGLYTTSASADAYEKVVSAIAGEAGNEGNLLVTSMLPFGYLCTELRPAAQSVWHSPYSERLMRYYLLHPDRLPDRIVSVSEGMGMSYGDGDVAALLARLKAEYELDYEKTDHGECIVFDRVP